VDINSVPTGLRLNKTSGRYALSGWLESSIFDTGSASSNFTTLTWSPVNQSASTNLEFQIASSNDPAGPWEYLGPDDTVNTFYTTAGTNISAIHDNNRYLRYKVYLSTLNDRETPILTSVQFNYVSGCYTPGQTYFGDLTAGNNYSLDVSLPGYQSVSIPSINVNGNQPYEVLMSP
jgi:hypothetical protein